MIPALLQPASFAASPRSAGSRDRAPHFTVVCTRCHRVCLGGDTWVAADLTLLAETARVLCPAVHERWPKSIASAPSASAAALRISISPGQSLGSV
jgi:hypothetical protein